MCFFKTSMIKNKEGDGERGFVTLMVVEIVKRGEKWGIMGGGEGRCIWLCNDRRRTETSVQPAVAITFASRRGGGTIYEG